MYILYDTVVRLKMRWKIQGFKHKILSPSFPRFPPDLYFSPFRALRLYQELTALTQSNPVRVPDIASQGLIPVAYEYIMDNQQKIRNKNVYREVFYRGFTGLRIWSFYRRTRLFLDPSIPLPRKAFNLEIVNTRNLKWNYCLSLRLPRRKIPE